MYSAAKTLLIYGVNSLFWTLSSRCFTLANWFLVLGYLMLLLSKRPKYEGVQVAIGLTLLLGFLSAAVTTLLGYWLSLEGGYDAKLLNQHKWLGVATTVLSAVVYGVHRSKKAGKMLLPLYTLTVIGLLITGHLGGNITHGSDFW